MKILRKKSRPAVTAMWRITLHNAAGRVLSYPCTGFWDAHECATVELRNRIDDVQTITVESSVDGGRTWDFDSDYVAVSR